MSIESFALKNKSEDEKERKEKLRKRIKYLENELKEKLKSSTKPLLNNSSALIHNKSFHKPPLDTTVHNSPRKIKTKKTINEKEELKSIFLNNMNTSISYDQIQT